MCGEHRKLATSRPDRVAPDLDPERLLQAPLPNNPEELKKLQAALSTMIGAVEAKLDNPSAVEADEGDRVEETSKGVREKVLSVLNDEALKVDPSDSRAKKDSTKREGRIRVKKALGLGPRRATNKVEEAIAREGLSDLREQIFKFWEQ